MGRRGRGWDRVETPYLENVRAAGIEVELSAEPAAPRRVGGRRLDGVRGPRRGRTRAELLAELVSLRDSIVVAGAHGKTTTTAMIAFVLDRLGLDPAFLVGGEVPQLGGNARARERVGSSSRATSPTGRSRRCGREIAVVTNVDLDHHSEFALARRGRGALRRWLAHVPKVVRGDELEPVAFELGVPGEHNRRNAAAALAALELAGVDRARGARARASSAASAAASSSAARRAAFASYDDYAHNPRRSRRRSRPRASAAPGACSCSSSRTSTRARGTSRTSSAAALAGGDVVAVTDVYPAREEPVEGVTGKLVVDALAEQRPGMPVAWTPALDDGARSSRRGRAPGDSC